jgi:hypothetical protein
MKVWVVCGITEDEGYPVHHVVGAYKNEPSEKFMSEIGFGCEKSKISYVEKRQVNIYEGEF